MPRAGMLLAEPLPSGEGWASCDVDRGISRRKDYAGRKKLLTQ